MFEENVALIRGMEVMVTDIGILNSIVEVCSMLAEGILGGNGFWEQKLQQINKRNVMVKHVHLKQVTVDVYRNVVIVIIRVIQQILTHVGIEDV